MTVEYPLSRVLEALLLDDPKVVGPIDRTVTHPAAIGQATSDRAVTFCTATGARASELIGNTGAGVVLCLDGVDESTAAGRTLIMTANPRLAFIRVVGALFTSNPIPGIDPTAVVDERADVAASATVGPFAFIGPDCRVGESTIIHGHVNVGAGAQIGNRVTIHPGTVIGADGFSYERDDDGTLVKFPHVGGVVIGDDVEIGANTCIDRGSLGDTVVESGAKVDNLVHIAHNVVVGRDALVIANAVIGGSTRIGPRAWIAPSVTLRDGIEIGHDAVVGLGSVVLKDVEPETTVAGAPARELSEYKRMLDLIKELMRKG